MQRFALLALATPTLLPKATNVPLNRTSVEDLIHQPGWQFQVVCHVYGGNAFELEPATEKITIITMKLRDANAHPSISNDSSEKPQTLIC